LIAQDPVVDHATADRSSASFVLADAHRNLIRLHASGWCRRGARASLARPSLSPRVLHDGAADGEPSWSGVKTPVGKLTSAVLERFSST
jgi:hypothetical protein